MRRCIDKSAFHFAELPLMLQTDVQLLMKIADLDGSYPGGLPAYLSKAKTLLKESADGTNPFEEFEASVPEGESLSFEEPNANPHTGMTFTEAEQAGLTGIGDTVFVLVAGGLGERLGYSGIKLSLETNLCTNKCYLEVGLCQVYPGNATNGSFEDRKRSHPYSFGNHDKWRY